MRPQTARDPVLLNFDIRQQEEEGEEEVEEVEEEVERGRWDI